jgi:hypothetical protein
MAPMTLRILIGLLLAANLLVLAWLQGWIATPGESGAAGRADRQVNAGLLTIEAVGQAPAAASVPVPATTER